MTPEVLDAPASTVPTASEQTARPAQRAPSTDALLSLEQAAILLGESPSETRDLTSMGLLKHQLIDGERCVRLGDLITYKRDFDKRFAEWQADPLNRMWDDPFFHETFGMAEIPETR